MLVLISKPSTTAVPPDMVSSPVSMRNVVVLPAPLIPRRPKHSLMGTPRLKLSTATNGERPGNQRQDANVIIALYLLLARYLLVSFVVATKEVTSHAIYLRAVSCVKTKALGH